MLYKCSLAGALGISSYVTLTETHLIIAAEQGREMVISPGKSNPLLYQLKPQSREVGLDSCASLSPMPGN